MDVYIGEIHNCSRCSIFAYKSFYGTVQEYNRLWNREIIFKQWMLDKIVEGVNNQSVVKRFKECAEEWLGEFVNNDSYEYIVKGRLGTVKLPSKSQIEDNYYMVLLEAKIDVENLNVKNKSIRFI
jgi:hypothetical protein